jgi:hypothetical protein
MRSPSRKIQSLRIDRSEIVETIRKDVHEHLDAGQALSSFSARSGYINKIGIKKTKAGFEASIYELSARAYLAIVLNSINLEDSLMRVDGATASTILGVLISAREFCFRGMRS